MADKTQTGAQVGRLIPGERVVSRRLESVCAPSSFGLGYDCASSASPLAGKNQNSIHAQRGAITSQQVFVARADQTPPRYQLRYQI